MTTIDAYLSQMLVVDVEERERDPLLIAYVGISLEKECMVGRQTMAQLIAVHQDQWSVPLSKYSRTVGQVDRCTTYPQH